MPEDRLTGRAVESQTEMHEPVQRLSDLLSYRISVVNRAFEQEAGRNVAREHELSLTEVRVLGVLDELSPTTVKRLASVMRLRRPQVSRALALLHGRGLVAASQNPADGRSTNYATTKEGRQRVRDVLAVASSYHRQRISVLTADELAALDKTLDKLLSNADRPAEEI